MITAAAERDLKLKFAASTPICVLKKPFGTDALLDCLGRALQG